MQRQRGAEKEELFRPSPRHPKPGTASNRRTLRNHCEVSEHNRLTLRLAPGNRCGELHRGINTKKNYMGGGNGAKNCPGNRHRGLLWWIAPVELRGGAENRNGQEQVQKKTAKKSRSYGGVEFSRGVSAVTHIGRTKRSSFFLRLQGPEFRLTRRRVRNGLYGKRRILLSSSGPFGPPGSGSCFGPKQLSLVSSPGSNLPGFVRPSGSCFGSKRLPRFRLRVPTS